MSIVIGLVVIVIIIRAIINYINKSRYVSEEIKQYNDSTIKQSISMLRAIENYVVEHNLKDYNTVSLIPVDISNKMYVYDSNRIRVGLFTLYQNSSEIDIVDNVGNSLYFFKWCGDDSDSGEYLCFTGGKFGEHYKKFMPKLNSVVKEAFPHAKVIFDGSRVTVVFGRCK